MKYFLALIFMFTGMIALAEPPYQKTAQETFLEYRTRIIHVLASHWVHYRPDHFYVDMMEFLISNDQKDEVIAHALEAYAETFHHFPGKLTQVQFETAADDLILDITAIVAPEQVWSFEELKKFPSHVTRDLSEFESSFLSNQESKTLYFYYQQSLKTINERRQFFNLIENKTSKSVFFTKLCVQMLKDQSDRELQQKMLLKMSELPLVDFEDFSSILESVPFGDTISHAQFMSAWVVNEYLQTHSMPDHYWAQVRQLAQKMQKSRNGVYLTYLIPIRKTIIQNEANPFQSICNRILALGDPFLLKSSKFIFSSPD